ncbi:MAG: competence/damage-inducible protein A [Odoribacter sp.]|nr:competence/damage-inducible protein A [Odoribacter sp.]
MKAIIITIGDEILMGQILNSNAQYIARQLTLTGMEVTEMLTIADREEEIRKAVDEAMKNADLIITTGGLGPTRDDITKKVLAEYFGTTLTYNEEAMQWLTELLKDRNLVLNDNNKTQAMLPENCRLLRNFKGTACGMWFEKDEKILVSLPGVPFEMEHLMERYVIPDL